MENKRRHEKKRLQKEKDIKETLANLENGVFETYQFAGANSEAWENFLKIRKCEKKEHVDFVQCIECKGLLAFKEGSGTSHLLRHRCPNIRTDEGDGNKFRSLPLDRIAPTRKLITNNIIKYCTSDMVSCEAVCDSNNFLNMVQSFVLHGHKNGYTDLKNVFPDSNQVNRAFGKIKEEKTQDICKKFQDSIKQQWCSATIETQSYDSPTHNNIKAVIMSIQYFENELKGLKKTFCLSFILRDDDTPDSFLGKLIICFNTIGGDKDDLLALKIVTPNEDIFSNAFASPFSRINCVADAITKILNEALKPTFLTEGSDTLPNCLGIVKHINSMGKYHVELRVDDGTLKSKLNMLRSIIENSEDILKILEDEDRDLQCNKRKVEEFISFLEPFVDAIDDLSASSYTTSNKILLWHAVLTDHLKSHDNCSLELKRIISNTKELLGSRFRPTLDNNIDCFLDPRYKALKMLANTERDHVITEVRKLLETLVIDVELLSYTPATKKRDPKTLRVVLALEKKKTLRRPVNSQDLKLIIKTWKKWTKLIFT